MVKQRNEGGGTESSAPGGRRGVGRRKRRPAPASPRSDAPVTGSSRFGLGRSAFIPALAGCALLWAAFPPLAWWPLAWLAPIFWLGLVRRPQLPGRRPYLAIWLASFLQWIALLEGIRLAHITMYGGWIALAFYTSLYLPVFVAVSRVAVHRFRWPLPLAAAVVWVGLELARGYLLTGFSMALIGHTQVSRLRLLQLADVFGAYGVSFVLLFVTGCLTQLLFALRGSRSLSAIAPPLAAAAAILIASGLYGQYRLTQDAVTPLTEAETTDDAPRVSEDPSPESLNVALIQCAKDIIFEHNPERNAEIFDQCRRQTLRASERHPDLQLLIWPESAFTEEVREVLVEGPLKPPPELKMDPADFRKRVHRIREIFAEKVEHVVALANRPIEGDRNRQRDIHLIVGCEAEYLGDNPRRYNSTLHLLPEGEVGDRYFKMHRVMFGEYIPLGDWLPWIYSLTPMRGGLTPGVEPKVFDVHGWKLTPTICFESTVPHLVRNQIKALTAKGKEPDVLVNVTNDGWFRNSGILDLHYRCAVFRAVENRIPVLVAANQGISAWIDGSGRPRAQVPRRVPSYAYAQVTRDPRESLYRRIGDAPAWACLIAVVIFATAGLVRRNQDRPTGDARDGAAER